MSNANAILDILGDEGDSEAKIKPQTRLELSVNPNDGSLLTAPLSLIINSATDALYNDLHNMANGQPLTLFIPSGEDSTTSTKDNNGKMSYTRKSEAMSSLPYQQRRHILASRISRHIQSLSHVSSLVASNLPNSATVSKYAGRASSQPNIYALAQIPPENELSQIVQTASQALEHVRTSWVSADTAQDAMYFHHDSLWKIRSHPHDVYGSMDVMLKGGWKDMSRDVKLEDRFRDSEERAWGEEETKERLRAVVRRKLVLGEIGSQSQSQKQKQSFKWNVTLEKDMLSVRLNYGLPRVINGTKVFPLEARLTVLSEENPAPWSLLSIRVRADVKTGESNHQLELSKEQMFGFHRICERAMLHEEYRAKKAQSEYDSDAKGKKNDYDNVARPLDKLLQLCHIFSLSWQIEILSSQAESLRKGAWSGQSSNKIGEGNGGISVTPVHFFSDDEQFDANGLRVKPLAYMAIHFWHIDDRHGKPKLDPLFIQEESVQEPPLNITMSNETNSKRLTLEIRAVPSKGLEVSLSGGNEAEGGNPHLLKNIKKLLSSLQDPFQLSVSDALLSGVIICCERRSHAVCEALLNTRKLSNIDTSRTKVLPSWLDLFVECGTISVGVKLSYDDPTIAADSKRQTPVILFRMACDSRTGKFVVTFPKASSLLRRLACHDPSSSEIQFLRQVKAASGMSNNNKASVRGRESTGRAVRDSFQSLMRSIDILGRRVGVGGDWNDVDFKFSAALREKSIMEVSGEVCALLMSCAGVAAVYGVGALAIGVAGGSEAVLDIGGGSIPSKEKGTAPFISVPPLSVIMNQQLIEHHTVDMNGERSTTMLLEREICGITASLSNAALTLHLFEMITQVDSVTSRKFRLRKPFFDVQI